MKSLFSLVLGTIVLFLAITAQGSPSLGILLAFVGLALFAVALSPGASRGRRKLSLHLDPVKPRMRASDGPSRTVGTHGSP